MSNTSDVAETWGRPYCANCGHDLTGLVDSAKCSECGRPLVEILVREANKNLRFKRYASKAKLFGLPAIAVSKGIGPDGKPGHARGWIAIGDKATGVVALGGLARGILAIGGTSIGLFSFGGMSIGLLTSFGGLSIAPLGLAIGGMSIGALAWGGMTAGFAAVGGSAYSFYHWAPSGIGVHRVLVRGGSGDPAAMAFFDSISLLFGPPSGRLSFLRPLAWTVTILVSVGAALAAPAIMRWAREADDESAKGGHAGEGR
ncbi:MAG: zinc ribbon domain-containing protein [Phycisphaerae bacterium]|jgi:hypothetical protein|nr:zinc ribbon domain-containing protein [Phycisphaerae bacterium]